jgi:integrase/recombinase XerD
MHLVVQEPAPRLVAGCAETHWVHVVAAARRQPGPARVNAIVAVVREFCKHAVACGWTAPDLLGVLYELSDDRWLPDEVRGENATPRAFARARHRLPQPERRADRATNDEVVALVTACRSARDRFIVLALARGLRRGELVSLRREDVHFVLDASGLGCDVAREHLHIVRRDVSPRRAFAKSRRARILPVDALLVQAWDAYWWERAACRAAERCDFVLVNLFREPLGAPMRPGALNELLVVLSRRARLDRQIHPHMLRHGFASDVLDAGGALDEAQHLLGHARPQSLQPYLHPSTQRMRDAVERTASYREQNKP